MTITRCAGTVLLLAGLGICAQARPAGALELSVSPVQVHLAPNQKSAIIRIGNPNPDAITVQATVFAWTQDANGTDTLEPVSDLLVFPQMLKIKEGIERNVRVGTTNPDRTSERTYRILLEPVFSPKATQADGNASRAAAATIITRSSVPVFVAPKKGVPAPIKVTSRMDKDALILQVTNPGTVHILPPTVTVKGYSATNELLFEHDTHGWYVLAGATRTDRLRLPKGRCADLRRLAVEVVSGQQTETLTVPVTSDACPQ